MIQCGLAGLVLRQRWFPVAGGVMVRFERPLHILEKITLKSSICGWDNKWLYFRHDILTGNTRAARATARGLFRTRGKSVPTADLLGAIQYTGPAIDPPPSIRQWIQADELMREATGEALQAHYFIDHLQSRYL